MSFICHIHNYTEYNQQWNVFSAFNPSKCTHLEQWAADSSGARGAVGGSVPCSRVSPHSWTIPAGAEIWPHNLGLQVRHYPLEPRPPTFYKKVWEKEKLSESAAGVAESSGRIQVSVRPKMLSAVWEAIEGIRSALLTARGLTWGLNASADR